MTLKIHMAGLFGGLGVRKAWCGRTCDDSQLPIIGTDREANCVACARSTIAHEHAQRWDYDHRERWKEVLP